MEFNDSQLGVVLGSVFHTLGAIAFLGGLVGYLAWHRALARGHDHRRVLDTAAFLTYIAIVVNLLGGFMRTYQTGHPHIWQFAESPWVRAITIKHLFLFAGQGAAIYLFEVIAPRLAKAYKAGTLTEPNPLGHRVGVVLVALGIIVAAVLGALTQVVPLVSADAPIEDHDMHDGPTVEYHNATGQLTSTALQPSASTGSFRVPNGTVLLEATLIWTPTQYSLRLGLVDPEGNTMQTAAGAMSAGSLSFEVDAPKQGEWTYSVESDLAINAAWTLSVRMSVLSDNEELLAGTRTIPPGQFFEINTEMENQTSFYWAWSASGTVHFNVHSHFDDEVQDHVDEDGEGGRGNFTNSRKGGYSLLWQNDGALPVSLDYRVWGDFTLESVFPA